MFSTSGKKVKFTVAEEFSGISDYILKQCKVYEGKGEIELETKTLTEILDEHKLYKHHIKNDFTIQILVCIKN